MTTATDALTTGTWAIDPVHSTVDFSVRHLMVSKVRGTFESFSGAIAVDESGEPVVTAEINVTSVNTGSEQRDGHVRSADFFDVGNFPTAHFVSTGLHPNGDNYILDGNLTLKGVTKQISLNLEFGGVSAGQGHGHVAGFEATVVLNRKDFGISLDLPMETGGAVVSDQVVLTLDIEAVKQS